MKLKLIRKASNGIEVPETKQDNARVVRIIVPKTNKPEPKFIPKGLLAQFTSDNRTPQQKETDYKVGSYLAKQNEISQNTAEGLSAFGRLMSPSTYIGPAVRMVLDKDYRNNGLPYWQRVTNGDGTGNVVGDLVTDVAAFGLPSLVKSSGNYLWNLGLIQAGKRGNLWAANRAIANTMSKIQNPDSYIPNNLGWAPKLTISVSNKKTTARPLTLYYPERWDVVNEGAPAHGVWFLGKWGLPRTVHTNSKPGKAEKAIKARNLFANRPIEIKGKLTLDKPMLTIGDVSDRASVEKVADNMGSDGLIFNNVYDNGFDNNQVIFSYKLPLNQTMSTSFKSELDWSPKSWFGDAAKRTSWTPEDEVILASHVPEYNQIELTAKANGTWLKMKDGSTWQGDPRSWVLMQSKYAKGKFRTPVVYHNSKIKFDEFNSKHITDPDGAFFVSTDPKYTSNFGPIQYQGRLAGKLMDVKTPFMNGELYKVWMEDASRADARTNPLNLYKGHDKVTDEFSPSKGHEYMFLKSNLFKSLIGNNGNFNLKDKNIYRVGIPTLLGGTYLKQKGEP